MARRTMATVLPPRARQWGSDLLGALAVVAVTLLLGSRVLGPNVSVPEDLVAQFQPFNAIAPQPVRNWILSDVTLVTYPNRVFMQRAFAAGQFPLWNPYLLSGQPTASDPLMALFYPTTHLFSHLTAARSLDYEMLLHILIAATGMYVAVRVLGGRPLGAVVAAACFAGGCTLTVWQQYGNVLTCGAWLPWLFVCFTMLQRGRRRVLWIGAGGIVLGLIILANDVQWLLYDLLFVACYALWMSVDAARTRKSRFLARSLLDVSILMSAIATVVLGFGVGAVQFLPEFALAVADPRLTSHSYNFVQAAASPPEWLLTLFAPNFFGTPAALGSEWLPKSNYPESMVYWGFFPALIAFTAPLWRRTTAIWFLWGSLLVATSVTFGSPTLHLYAFLPGFNALEAARLSYLMCFAGAMLAGLTLDRLFMYPRGWAPFVVLGTFAVSARAILHIALTRFHPTPLITLAPTQESLHWVTLLVIAGSVLLAGGLVRQPTARRIAAVGFALLIVADIAHFSLPYNAATVPEASVFPRPQVFNSLPDSIVPPRIVPINAKDSIVLLAPNMLEVFGLADMGAYQQFVLPDYKGFLDQIEPVPFRYNGHIIVFTNATSPLFDLAGVDYFVSATPLDLTRKPLTLVMAAQGVYLYRNPTAAPRAFIVADVRTPDTRQAVWQNLTAPGYISCSFATVEGPSPLTARNEGVENMSAGCPGVATITRYEPNRVHLRAETPTEGVLVLTDAYQSDWQVTVDGVRQPVLKVDGAFRGVHLTSGTHDVRFEFRPVLVYQAGAISGIALIACIALVIIGLRTLPR